MTGELGQSDFEDLSAYLDGELGPQRTAEIARLIAEDATWRDAHRQLAAIDAAMDAYEVPAPPEGLADRVVARVRRKARRPLVLRVIGWLAPAAAAAAIILVVLAVMNRPDAAPVAGELVTSPALQAVPQAERADVENMIVENLGFFRDYEVIAQFETLEAIDHLEKGGT